MENRSADVIGAPAIRGRETVNNGADNAIQSRRFVTFYFTNFPSYLSNFYLQKGLEVCGMLEKVVVPARHNVDGEVYGFVRYSNVRDVCKLLKVVNSVCFGNINIVAKVARFDKAAAREVEKGCVGGGGAIEVSKEKVKVGEWGLTSVGEGVVKVVRGSKVVSEGGKDVTVGSMKGSVKGDGKGVCSEKVVKEREGAMVKVTNTVEDVRVGDVLVRVHKRKPYHNEIVSGKKGTYIGACGYITNNMGQHSIQKIGP